MRKEIGGIGFKDLQQFHVAMLTKQEWRILINPNCLMARLLKAKYFKDRDFWEAAEGGNPSSIWRSILEGRALLKKGMRRHIGDGQGTWVWHTTWLPDVDNAKVTTEFVDRLENMSVSDLMLPGTHVWDSTKIADLFNL